MEQAQVAEKIESQRSVKERPILFSAPMVRAILEGRKTQTRRVVKPQPIVDGSDPVELARSLQHRPVCADSFTRHYCPYGQPGGRLWVREAWATVPISSGCEKADLSRDPDQRGIRYRATWDRTHSGAWRPSIHMPRWASRITLEITDVRVERLQEISEKDAVSEGLESTPEGMWLPGVCAAPEWAFRELWSGIHGDDSWNQNPWVWVIEFKKVSPS